MTKEETALAERLGEAIRRARKVRGWSQATLASRAGTSPNHIGNMERGMGLPSVGMLAALAGLLSISIDALLSDAPQRPERQATDPDVSALYEGIPAELRPMALRVLRDFARQGHQPSAATAAKAPRSAPRASKRRT